MINGSLSNKIYVHVSLILKYKKMFKKQKFLLIQYAQPLRSFLEIWIPVKAGFTYIVTCNMTFPLAGEIAGYQSHLDNCEQVI